MTPVVIFSQTDGTNDKYINETKILIYQNVPQTLSLVTGSPGYPTLTVLRCSLCPDDSDVCCMKMNIFLLLYIFLILHSEHLRDSNTTASVTVFFVFIEVFELINTTMTNIDVF